MPQHRSIANEAHECYTTGRMGEAALLLRRAAAAARDIGDQTAFFEHTVWAAQATVVEGRLPAALELVLSARQDEPEDAPWHEALMTRKLFVEITQTTRPERARLRDLIDDLRRYAASHRVPKGDIPEIEGALLCSRGDWSAAVAAYETAWGDHDGEGYLRFEKAYYAALCSLRIGRIAACKDWLKAMTECDKEYVVNAVAQSELALRLALAEGKPACEIIALLRTFQERVAATQRATSRDILRELTVRVHSLDTAAGDPGARQHPARQELRHRTAARYNVSVAYEARLVHLDYRLACLRCAAGVPPVEDLYYTQPQRVPNKITVSVAAIFARRLHKAHAAAQWALGYAAKLDGLLECDWRQREVRARIERIEQIANAARTDAC